MLDNVKELLDLGAGGERWRHVAVRRSYLCGACLVPVVAQEARLAQLCRGGGGSGAAHDDGKERRGAVAARS